MPLVNASVEANNVPPLDASYHFTFVPLTDRLATVGADALQNTCVADALGASGVVFTVTATTVLVALSQLLVV